MAAEETAEAKAQVPPPADTAADVKAAEALAVEGRQAEEVKQAAEVHKACLLYTSPSPRD